LVGLLLKLKIEPFLRIVIQASASRFRQPKRHFVWELHRSKATWSRRTSTRQQLAWRRGPVGFPSVCQANVAN